ncbi:skin secretory protein xP2-like [Sus scrofa]|uniref:skin secretory protein xP2-like n=1 Tax=Sus scrofa TaxID=9823 RepID=UPI000A2B3B9B|nr:skin secretory protein xP2-like [Sus scrofa]
MVRARELTPASRPSPAGLSEGAPAPLPTAKGAPFPDAAHRAARRPPESGGERVRGAPGCGWGAFSAPTTALPAEQSPYSPRRPRGEWPREGARPAAASPKVAEARAPAVGWRDATRCSLRKTVLGQLAPGDRR